MNEWMNQLVVCWDSRWGQEHHPTLIPTCLMELKKCRHTFLHAISLEKQKPKEWHIAW